MQRSQEFCLKYILSLRYPQNMDINRQRINQELGQDGAAHTHSEATQITFKATAAVNF